MSLSPSQVLQAWKDLNLTNLQRDLDEEGLIVVENQQKSLLARKQLSEATKEWKKLDSQEQLSQFKSLLKSYQQEIDANTKRCKTAEGYFLNIYKKLNSISDPTLLLEGYIQQAEQLKSVKEKDDQIKTLKDELMELTELRGVENELTKSKRKLVEFEDKMESMLSEKLHIKEAEWRQELESKIHVYKEGEHSLQRQNAHLKSELANLRLQSQTQVNSTLDATEQDLLKKQATQAQVDLLIQDLDKMSQRVQSLTRENTELKGKLNETNSNEESIVALETEIEILKYKMETQAKELNDTISQTSQKLQAAQIEISTLQLKLIDMKDYEVLKKELSVLKATEFEEVSI